MRVTSGDRNGIQLKLLPYSSKKSYLPL